MTLQSVRNCLAGVFLGCMVLLIMAVTNAPAGFLVLEIFCVMMIALLPLLYSIKPRRYELDWFDLDQQAADAIQETESRRAVEILSK